MDEDVEETPVRNMSRKEIRDALKKVNTLEKRYEQIEKELQLVKQQLREMLKEKE